ncbi:hypothetical protein [Kitasatospora viridis]|uniref:hypothetical protein n=1 Tax=Kitasatospora viridis TaxID=281105 RepID=UPI0011A44D58|nr:hypothetical protein [Kitasatospora viridis]
MRARAHGSTICSVVVAVDEVADAVQEVEQEGWRLGHVSAYAFSGGGGPYRPKTQVGVLLVFRKEET